MCFGTKWKGIPTSVSNTTLLEYFKSFGQVVAIQRYETDNQALLQFKLRWVDSSRIVVLSKVYYEITLFKESKHMQHWKALTMLEEVNLWFDHGEPFSIKQPYQKVHFNFKNFLNLS